MAPLSHKKDRGISKSGFVLKDQSVTLNFELSYNERTLTNITFDGMYCSNILLRKILFTSRRSIMISRDF